MKKFIARLKLFALVSFVMFFSLVFSGQGCSKQVLNSTDNASSISDLPPSHPPDDPAAKVQSITSKILVMDRSQISSFFLQIFGPSVQPIVTSDISRQYSQFGLACDPHNNIGDNDCNPRIVDNRWYHNEWARDAFAVGTSVNVGVTTLREGLRISACDKATSMDSAVQYAVGLIGKTTNVAPTPTDLSNLATLFYPDYTGEFDQALIQLQAEATRTQTPINQWRVQLIFLCRSPDWQIL